MTGTPAVRTTGDPAIGERFVSQRFECRECVFYRSKDGYYSEGICCFAHPVLVTYEANHEPQPKTLRPSVNPGHCCREWTGVKKQEQYS